MRHDTFAGHQEDACDALATLRKGASCTQAYPGFLGWDVAQTPGLLLLLSLLLLAPSLTAADNSDVHAHRTLRGLQGVME